MRLSPRHNLPLLATLICVQAADGRPVGAKTIIHFTDPLTITIGAVLRESHPLIVIKAQVHKIILGLPWLQYHNPTISWAEMDITTWMSQCQTISAFPSLWRV